MGSEGRGALKEYRISAGVEVDYEASPICANVLDSILVVVVAPLNPSCAGRVYVVAKHALRSKLRKSLS
jgi:hypothetical protein